MVQPKTNDAGQEGPVPRRPGWPRAATAGDAESARLRTMTADWDDESKLCWEKLIELALNAPGSIVHIAQQRAPEVAARVAKMSETT